MNLGTLRQLIRAYVPGATVQVVSNAVMNTLINQGVHDVNSKAFAYKSNKKFDVVAEAQTYLFSENITDLILIDSGGLWWNSGSATTPVWQRLDPYNRESLDSNWPHWKDDDSDDPLRYIIENDSLIVHPKPDTTLTEGFWAFYVKKAVEMTDDSHYPFTGSTTEIASLSILDDAIIDYVRWKLTRPLGSDKKGMLSEEDYKKSVASAAETLRVRLDITGHPDLRMRGPSIG